MPNAKHHMEELSKKLKRVDVADQNSKVLIGDCEYSVDQLIDLLGFETRKICPGGELHSRGK